MKKAKKTISITLDVDLIEKLRALAEKDDRTLSQYINKILKLYVADKSEDGGTMYFHFD